MTSSPLPPRHAPLRSHVPPVDHALKAAQLNLDRTLRLAQAAFAAAQPERA